MNKRGEGEQFNWIFVIVAGSILLGFFVLFTFKYVELEEPKITFYLVKDSSSEEFVENLDISSAFRTEVVDSRGVNINSNSKVVYFTISKPSVSIIQRLQGNLK